MMKRNSNNGTVHDSSKESSALLTACVLRLREGNDNPHRMDYQGRKHLLSILYTLRCESIGCYFAYDVIRTVQISIDVPPV